MLESLNRFAGNERATEEEKAAYDRREFISDRAAFVLPELANYGNKDFMDCIYGMIKKFDGVTAEIHDERKGEYIKAVMESKVPHKFLPQNQEYNRNHFPVSVNAQISKYMHGMKKNQSRNLYLHGPSFVGKSNLAARILLDALDTVRPGYWLNLPAYCEAVKNFHGPASWIAEEMGERAISARMLVMDDFGKEYEKYLDEKSLSFFGQKLYAVLEARRHKATIFTAEFAPDELRAKLTDAVVNRAIEGADIIDMRNVKRWEV